jgi:hypothetical protein
MCVCVFICVYSCIFYAPRYVVSVACLALSHERHGFWENSEQHVYGNEVFYSD